MVTVLSHSYSLKNYGVLLCVVTKSVQRIPLHSTVQRYGYVSDNEFVTNKEEFPFQECCIQVRFQIYAIGILPTLFTEPQSTSYDGCSSIFSSFSGR